MHYRSNGDPSAAPTCERRQALVLLEPGSSWRERSSFRLAVLMFTASLASAGPELDALPTAPLRPWEPLDLDDDGPAPPRPRTAFDDARLDAAQKRRARRAAQRLAQKGGAR